MTAPSLSTKQATSIAEAQARINLWHGAVRSGKTIASILAWLHYVATAGPGPLAMVGKTKDTLARNVIDPMADLFGDLGPAAVAHTRGANTAVILGRLVHVVGAHDAKSESRIRGLTLRGAYVDEASLVPEAFWRQLTFRLSLPDARLFATTNPDSPRHWLKRDWLDKAAHLGVREWHFTLDDNPGLEDAYVEALKRENVGLWYDRFILGLWRAAEGSIYDMLRLEGPDSHVVDTLPEVHAWWLTCDYGTTNPFHALLIGEHADGLVVAREWRWDSRAQRRQLTDGEYSERLKGWADGGCDGATDGPPDLGRIFVDPSAASFVRQLHRDGWPVTQADNTVDDGIREVASLLATGRLTIHESCSHLLDEMSGYSWDPKAQERGEDAPLKQDDHGVDALRYGVRGLRRVWRRWIDAA